MSSVRIPGTAAHPRAIVCAAVLKIAVIGCGPTTDRLPISGEVRLDGQPINSGSISLNSTDPAQTLTAGAKIVDGEFDVPREKGLPPGVYYVSISSPDRDGPKVPFKRGPGYPPIMVARERIPQSYNLASEHTIELAADARNHFEFDIPSAP